jgi:hypothetical protein
MQLRFIFNRDIRIVMQNKEKTVLSAGKIDKRQGVESQYKKSY